MMLKLSDHGDGWQITDGYRKVAWFSFNGAITEDRRSRLLWMDSEVGTADKIVILVKDDYEDGMIGFVTNHPAYLLNDNGKTIEKLN